MQLSIDADAVATLTLDGPKANAIDPAFLDGLGAGFAELQGKGARAVVLTGSGKFFSGGLDLPFVTTLDRAALRRFMRRFSDVMLGVFGCPLPVVAAVNGHAIAGGCVLALMADVRLMADGPYKIGLNEVALGIGLPAEVLEPARAQLPAASLQPLLLEGRLVQPAEAQRLGLVHEVTAEGELLEKSRERARVMAKLPGKGLAQVKRGLRQEALTRALATRDALVEEWLETWFSPGAQEVLKAAAAKLSKK